MRMAPMARADHPGSGGRSGEEEEERRVRVISSPGRAMLRCGSFLVLKNLVRRALPGEQGQLCLSRFRLTHCARAFELVLQTQHVHSGTVSQLDRGMA
jgi:hypothetical protein